MPIVYQQREIGQRGRAQRQKLGISVETLALELGVSRKRMVEFERLGVGSLRRLVAWAKALRMPPGELAFGPNPRR